MKPEQYSYLIGKTKKEILKELGEQFNFYPSNIWTYYIKRDLLFRKITLFLFFKDDKLNEFTLKKSFK